MKKAFAIILVILMTVQCFYKLGVITYFNLNREYIAKVLCINKEEPITMCYGQCFLKRNLVLPDQPVSDQSRAPKTTTQNVDFPAFLLSEVQCAVNSTPESGEQNTFYKNTFSKAHTSIPFHPPTNC